MSRRQAGPEQMTACRSVSRGRQMLRHTEERAEYSKSVGSGGAAKWAAAARLSSVSAKHPRLSLPPAPDFKLLSLLHLSSVLALSYQYNLFFFLEAFHHDLCPCLRCPRAPMRAERPCLSQVIFAGSPLPHNDG